MQKIAKSLFFFLLTIQVSAQNSQADSLIFAKTQWQNVRLGRKLTWLHHHFANKELFNSNQNIHILRLKNGSRRHPIAFASGGDSLLLSSVLAQQNQALAAVNGSFFDTKNGGSVDFIKIDGQVLDTTFLPRGKRAEHQMAALALDKNKLLIVKGDSTDAKWDEHLPYQNVMVTGPLLIFEGENTPLSKSAFATNRHPRTCACITTKNDVLLVTIDGRTAESQGVSLAEATQLMRWLGCQSAINLDGGGSTTFYVKGQPENGVVNMPCDNKKFDHAGERKVSNIIVVK